MIRFGNHNIGKADLRFIRQNDGRPLIGDGHFRRAQRSNGIANRNHCRKQDFLTAGARDHWFEYKREAEIVWIVRPDQVSCS